MDVSKTFQQGCWGIGARHREETRFSMLKMGRLSNEASDAQKGEMRNMCEILDKIENRGIEKGKAEGNAEGKSQMADLMKILLTENRIEDAKRAAEDPAYCDELMKQYGIG